MTQLTPPTWSRVKAILADALELDGKEREALLDRACAGQPALRKRLNELVRAAAATGALDDADSPARVLTVTFEPGPGQRVGRYRIVRLIGRGGMGAVYEAIDEQLARPVAVKLMRSGMTSLSMLKRFELESRLLARLRHPGIAQIFEAGTVAVPGSKEHVPFFAMELIGSATPITAFADAARLSIDDRLRLFVKVCDAVTHGHQRSVIHRDLKPANILVDASGQPKIIDFGVARASEAGAAVTTLVGEVLGTIRYMSPEQVAGPGDPEDLDVRTDVYSLGVVLYELLAGRPPHPDAEGGVLASISQAQNRTPLPLSHFAPHLAGDIQTVALKAVQPDRLVRYQSVAELAADLERILRHEPISARPLSAAYQIRMFTRRHRALVAGFATVFAALALGFIGTSIGLVRARNAERATNRHAERALRISNFLRNTIRSADPQLLPPATLAASDPSVYPWETWGLPPADWGSAGPADVGVTGVLRHAADHLEAEFGDDPALLAEVSILLGHTLKSLEDTATALRLFESAVAIQSRVLPADDEALIRGLVFYGTTLFACGRAPESLAPLRSAFESAQRRFGPVDPRTNYIGAVITRTIGHIPGRYEEALAIARQMIATVGAAKGSESGAAWLCHLPLIDLLRMDPSRSAEVVAECRATIEGLGRTIGPDIAPVARATWCLAEELQEDPATMAEAESLLRHSLNFNMKFRGPDSNVAYDGRSALLVVLMRQRHLAEAEALAREALDSSLRMIGPRSAYTEKAQARLARLLTWQEREPEEAERLARRAAEGSALEYGAAEDFAAYHHAIWAAAVRLGHRPEQAEAMLRERIALRGRRSPEAAGAWVEGYQYLQLALCLADEDRAVEAAAALGTARAWIEQLHDPTHPVLLNIDEVQMRLDRDPVR